MTKPLSLSHKVAPENGEKKKFISLDRQEAASGPAELVHRCAGLLGPDALHLHLSAHPLVHARGSLAFHAGLWKAGMALSENLQCASDILALKHVSGILGHCNNPALLFYPFVRVASPPV